MPGTLILCATPIGNLGDASPRLATALAECELIYCEDTRRSRILLNALGINKRLRSYFVGNEERRSLELASELRTGKTVALLTDAGTPSISDPGWSAVRTALKAGATVTVIPGPSALTAALSVSGFPSDRVVFEGFLPRKGRERQARIDEIGNETRTVVLFVGASHLLDDLQSLAEVHPQRPICVARELTKKFEEIVWTTCEQALEEWTDRPIKGEFTLVLSAIKERPEPDWEGGVEGVITAIAEGQSMTRAVRRVAGDLDLPRRQLYELVLARTRDAKPGH